MSDDLVTWLRVQFDDDERTAKSANPWPWRRFTDRSHLDPNTIFGSSYPGDQEKLRNVCSLEYSWKRDENGDHIVRWDPGHVLAEVEAKRRLINLAVALAETQGDGPVGEQLMKDASDLLLRSLVQPYADRPGYRDEWRVA